MISCESLICSGVIKAAKAKGFGEISLADVGLIAKIGQGPRHSQHPQSAAGAEFALPYRLLPAFEHCAVATCALAKGQAAELCVQASVGISGGHAPPGEGNVIWRRSVVRWVRYCWAAKAGANVAAA